MDKTYYSAIVVGATVEKKIADKFAEKCEPYTTVQVIEGFINSVVSGDLKISHKLEGQANDE